MKRIKAACLEQTIHFILKEDTGHAYAARAVKLELEAYKAKLDRDRVKYVILEETVQADDSVILKIKRQYNNYDCGEYLE